MIRWGVIGVDRHAWNDLGPELDVGREHAMEANEMEPWTGTAPAAGGFAYVETEMFRPPIRHRLTRSSARIGSTLPFPGVALRGTTLRSTGPPHSAHWRRSFMCC